MLTLSIAGKILEGVFGVPLASRRLGRVGGVREDPEPQQGYIYTMICNKRDISHYSGMISAAGAGPSDPVNYSLNSNLAHS